MSAAFVRIWYLLFDYFNRKSVYFFCCCCCRSSLFRWGDKTKQINIWWSHNFIGSTIFHCNFSPVGSYFSRHFPFNRKRQQTQYGIPYDLDLMHLKSCDECIITHPAHLFHISSTENNAKFSYFKFPIVRFVCIWVLLHLVKATDNTVTITPNCFHYIHHYLAFVYTHNYRSNHIYLHCRQSVFFLLVLFVWMAAAAAVASVFLTKITIFFLMNLWTCICASLGLKITGATAAIITPVMCLLFSV